MRVKPSPRVYLRIIGLGFALGVMFQTGMGVASHFWPRVTEVHIIQQSGDTAPTRSHF